MSNLKNTVIQIKMIKDDEFNNIEKYEFKINLVDETIRLLFSLPHD